MQPNLDDLLKKEAEAFEGVSQAFIKLSIARNNVQNALREMRENQPNLFTGEMDLNEVSWLGEVPPHQI
jgi:hypothetical protein